MAVLLHRTRHLMISLMFVFACLLTGCGSHIDPTLSLEDPALEWLISQETANVADAMAAMNSIEASREAQAQASREESKSIEESLRAESISKEAESLSIEQSEYAD